MIVEKLPIIREWEFYDDDDVVITFSLTNSGAKLPLGGGTAIAEIRDSDAVDATLISTGVCTISEDIISAAFPLADLASLVGSTLHGELRFLTADSKKVTLLKFTSLMKSTFSRFV